MPALKEKILSLVKAKPGLTDRQIADELLGPEKHQSPVNIACRGLEGKGLLKRREREDGKIGNFPLAAATAVPVEQRSVETVAAQPDGPEPGPETPRPSTEPDHPSEDAIKKILELDLKKAGWSVQVAYGGEHGIDIDAHRGKERWVFEVKGPGSRTEMRVNYFISILGELLQRMNDPNAKYSIALPDIEQFRRLWKRLPPLAKERTGISIVYVSKDGMIQEEK